MTILDDVGSALGTAASASPVGAIANVVGGIIDRIWPDPTINAQMKADLAKAQMDGTLQQYLSDAGLVKAQIDVDDDEAKSSSLFIAGWRPFIGWAGGAGFAVQFAIIPIVGYVYSLFGYHAPPELTLDPTLNEILFGILGLNLGARTYEKIKGVAS